MLIDRDFCIFCVYTKNSIDDFGSSYEPKNFYEQEYET